MQSESKKNSNKESIVFMIVDEHYMGMHLPYSISNDMVKSLVKQNGGLWCHNFKIWKIPKHSYTAVRTELPRIMPEATIEDLPLFIDRVLKPITEKLNIASLEQMIAYDPLDRKISYQDNPLYSKLYGFQKETLKLAIKNYGRLMIADEMGVGKTLQSLACAITYIRDWPLLIICPSALKHVWKEEITKWLNQKVKKEQIFIIDKLNTQYNIAEYRVVIYSYEIASKSLQILKNFNVVIVDQAHYLKNAAAKRTENLLPFLTTRKRIFLLSGTPALAKPREIFNLIQIIRPDIYISIQEFGDRYCHLQRNRWTHKMEYEGCRNLAELHYQLKNRIMIRRLKSEVLHELPQKQRQIITLETNRANVKEIKQLMNSNEIPLEVLRNSEKLVEEGESGQGISPLPRCYLLSGLAKLEGVKLYITSLLENDVKVLIFAHHKIVMDDLEEHLNKIKCEFIRIDGSTSNDNRKKNVKTFQENHLIRVALLSITAAGVGITLTAASTVIFAQLHWTPANLIQAEDRAHRIGQQSCVNVHYLIGQNTLDHLLLKQLQKKLGTTGILLNGTKQSLQTQSLKKGSLGRWSMSSFSKLRASQPKISDFMLKSKEQSEEKGKQEESDIDEDEILDEELEEMIKKKEEEIKAKLRNKILSEAQK